MRLSKLKHYCVALIGVWLVLAYWSVRLKGENMQLHNKIKHIKQQTLVPNVSEGVAMPKVPGVSWSLSEWRHLLTDCGAKLVSYLDDGHDKRIHNVHVQLTVSLPQLSCLSQALIEVNNLKTNQFTLTPSAQSMGLIRLNWRFQLQEKP